MKATDHVLTKTSAPEKVDEFMSKLKHPLFDVVEYLRVFILSTDKKTRRRNFLERSCLFLHRKNEAI
jgi:hypothetical protein